jgi:hypothetical protein
MNKVFTNASLGLAVLIFLVYGLLCTCRKMRFQYQSLVHFVLFSGTLVGAGLMAGSTLVPTLKQYVTDSETYMLISGLVVVALSVQGIYGSFANGIRKKKPSPGGPASKAAIEGVKGSAAQ